MDTQSQPSALESSPEPYRRAFQLLLIGCALIVVAVGIALYQLSRSNRPHELTMTPIVAGLAALNAVLCVLHWIQLRRAWPDRHAKPNRGLRYMIFPLGVGYTLVSGFVLLISVTTLITFWTA